MDFFKQLSPEEWAEKQAEAERANRKEITHASAEDAPLTSEQLKKIVSTKVGPVDGSGKGPKK